MKEYPILFKPEMVRAILQGHKTQSRRIIKTPRRYRDTTDVQKAEFWTPFADAGGHNGYWTPGRYTADWAREQGHHYGTGTACLVAGIRCPYGVPGDVLWGREGLHQEYTTADDDTPNGCLAIYSADGAVVHRDGRPAMYEWENTALPSIHMPRWACRITLPVVNMRVERVQDISEDDAVAEGCQHCCNGADCACREPAAIGQFIELWDSIHGPGAWERNDWVWVPQWEPY